MTQPFKGRNDIIEFLRVNGFNCFPVPGNTKAADSRYSARDTVQNQPIRDIENYGFIPIYKAGTCIIDFDDKEKFRKFAEENINNGYMVIETPHGWHIPIKGLTGEITKVELFDYDTQDKKIMEIQGPKHYCVGPNSTVDGVRYKPYNDKIWDAKNMDFHKFVDILCKNLGLSSIRKSSSTYAYLREKFQKGIPPSEGQSNDYFFQAALVCNTNEIPIDEAMEKIKAIYHLWEKTPAFSGRPWGNIESKINNVYDNNQKIKHGGHKEKGPTPEELAVNYLSNNKLYTDKTLERIYKTDNGFLEEVTTPLKYIVAKQFNTDEHTTNKIMWCIMVKSDDPPDTIDDKIRFKNGVYNTLNNTFDENDKTSICNIGFINYDYKIDPKPYKFCEMIHDQIEEESRINLLAFLSKVPTAEKEIRMAILYGIAGCGKSALASVLQQSLGGYAYGTTLVDFFKDRATQAKLIGKTLLYFQDTPKQWTDIDRLKQTTGETHISIRDMYKEAEITKNMLSIIMSSNVLPKIDSEDAGPMFDRLTLIKFKQKKIRGTDQDNENFSEQVAKSEGADIVSFCLNLRKYKYRFDGSVKTKDDWTNISCPEAALIEKYTRYDKESNGMSPIELKILLQSHTERKLDMDEIRKILKDKGYPYSQGLYKDLSSTVGSGTLDEVTYNN